jgi:uncharacterized membrane protein HdeD (DUF308 family)
MATVIETETPQVGAGWGWMLASGVLGVVLGLAALIWPFPATYAATLIVGAFFMAAGAVALGAGFFGRGHGRRGYIIFYGALSLVLGVLIAFWPLSGALSLTLLVAAWLGARGVVELIAGFRLRRHKALMIVLGVVNILLMLLIVATVPWSALTLPGYILGISFLFGGVTEISAAMAHRAGAPAFAV